MARITNISAVRILPRQQVLQKGGIRGMAPSVLPARTIAMPTRITLPDVTRQVHTLLNFESKPELLDSAVLRAEAIDKFCSSLNVTGGLRGLQDQMVSDGIPNLQNFMATRVAQVNAQANTDLDGWKGELNAADIPTNVEDLIWRMSDKEAPVVLVRVRDVTRCVKGVCDTTGRLMAVPVKELIGLRIQLAREGRTEESNKIRDIVHDTWRAIRKARELQVGIIPQRLGQLTQAIATVDQDPRLTPKEKEELKQASIELPILARRAQTNVTNLDTYLQKLEVDMAESEKTLTKKRTASTNSHKTDQNAALRVEVSELVSLLKTGTGIFGRFLARKDINFITEAFRQMYDSQAEEHVVYLRQLAKKELFEKLEEQLRAFKEFISIVEERSAIQRAA